MVGSFQFYGLEEYVGLHVILSNVFWWMSVFLVIIAYKYRRIWNVGNEPWTFLFLTFLFFGIRELGHLSESPLIGSLRYIFGIWSAIFMTSAFAYLFVVLYDRKKVSKIQIYAPFILALIFPVIMLYLYFSNTGISEIKNIMGILENLVWMVGSIMTIYTAYMLGTSATGGFISVFMFFQFAAYTAFIWKFMGMLEKLSWSVPYSIREIIETLFGVFAILSMYLLTRMLRDLSKHIYSE